MSIDGLSTLDTESRIQRLAKPVLGNVLAHGEHRRPTAGFSVCCQRLVPTTGLFFSQYLVS